MSSSEAEDDFSIVGDKPGHRLIVGKLRELQKVMILYRLIWKSFLFNVENLVVSSPILENPGLFSWHE
jgi:hypothetical protein